MGRRQELDVSNWQFNIENEKYNSQPKGYLTAFDSAHDQETPKRAFEKDDSDSSQENFTSRPSSTSSYFRESFSTFSGAPSRRISLKPNFKENNTENQPAEIQKEYDSIDKVTNEAGSEVKKPVILYSQKQNILANRQTRESEAAEERYMQKRRADLSEFERSIVERAKVVELPFNETIKNLEFSSQEEEISQLIIQRHARDSIASVFNDMSFDTSDEELVYQTKLNTLQNSIIEQIPFGDITNQSDISIGSPLSIDTIPNDNTLDSTEDEEFLYNPALMNIPSAPSILKNPSKKTPHTNEKFGLKRKYVAPSQDNENRRYPIRNRIKPVQHWRNERIVYDESNIILGVDVKDEGYLTKSDEKIYNREPKRPKLREKEVQQECQFPIYDPKTNKEVLEKVIYPKSSWVCDEEAKGKIVIVGEDDRIKLIVVSLKPDETIDLGIINSRAMGIIMMSGCFATQVTIHESVLKLSQWDAFSVPPKNKLTITNTSQKCSTKVHLQIEKI
ncbi:unnamed protein product [Blepharisma stoltei]|uniref:Uncharacterized protein n=1 Tax=Blepharisma stoltei TaxID=1481888 RepID=A0AAU9JP22_9CILI|nr:unnamed protein product [Blepharisma stoltei]